MVVFTVWFRDHLVEIFSNEEKAKQLVKDLEIEYNRKRIAYIMEMEVH